MALTLAQARTLLRRRLQEPTTVQWTDAELTSLINLGVSDVQKVIQGPDPDAYITSADQNIVADQADYDLPTGAWWPVQVGVLDDDGDMVDLGDPITLVEAIEPSDSTSETRWVRYGRKIRLSPTPTESVTNGLRVYFIQSLAASVEGDALPVPDPLHGLVVLYAEKWALGETGEAADAVHKEIDREEARIPMWLRRTGASETIRPDVVKGYDR